MDSAIIPECYVDTNFIETLIPTQNGYNHKKGCSTVMLIMDTKFTDRFALGIIDKDKRELDYMKEFTEVIKKGNLELYKHRSRSHYVIRIAPAIEKFVMTNADKVGVKLDSFDLPTDFDEFKNDCKRVKSKSDQRFKNLFKALKRAHSAEIELLIHWISYLKEHNYNADLEVLRAM